MSRTDDLSKMLYRRPDDVIKWQKFFEECVSLIGMGDVEAARDLFRQIDGVALRHLFHYSLQRAGRDRYEIIHGAAPKRKEGAADKLRATRMPTSKESDEILERDGCLCRYCHSPLLSKKDFTKFRKIIGESEVPVGPTNLAAHGVKFFHLASFDHIKAFSASRDFGLDNIVSSCHSCNFGKDAFSLADLRIAEPGPSSPTMKTRWMSKVQKFRDFELTV